jgi:hypothetical protein
VLQEVKGIARRAAISGRNKFILFNELGMAKPRLRKKSAELNFTQLCSPDSYIANVTKMITLKNINLKLQKRIRNTVKNKLFGQLCGHTCSLMREWNKIICYVFLATGTKGEEKERLFRKPGL